jgi:hypothetical protein
LLLKKGSFADFLSILEKNQEQKQDKNKLDLDKNNINQTNQPDSKTATKEDLINRLESSSTIKLKDETKKSHKNAKGCIGKIKSTLRSTALSIIVSISLLILLFLDDIRHLTMSKEYDFYIDTILFSFFCFIVVEVFFLAVFIKRYRFTIFFWLDIISILTLVSEISMIFPVTGDYIVDDTHSYRYIYIDFCIFS